MVVSRLEAIWFNINQQCNLECAHCLTNSGPSSKAPVLGLADLLQVAEEAHALGVGRFYLTGGEPTLHPEFFEMIEALQALGEVIFFTNATLFDEEKIERLEAVAEKERLEVRLSWTEYHFDSYQEMLPADPGMRYPIDVWKELKARGFRMTLVSMDGSGDKNLGLFPTLRGRQVCEVVPPAEEWFDGCDGSNSLTVWMDGRVFTCPPLTNVAPFKLGNIHTDSLQELLERRPDTIKSPQCAVCRQHEP
jgi:MoaA/NifB/PqqE/SkfB family radical SAM enzyme